LNSVEHSSGGWVPPPGIEQCPCGCGWVDGNKVLDDIRRYFPGLLTIATACPADHTYPDECVTAVPSGAPASVADVVVHLNDVCGWTREAIADWLDSLDIDLSITNSPAPAKRQASSPHDIATTIVPVESTTKTDESKIHTSDSTVTVDFFGIGLTYNKEHGPIMIKPLPPGSVKSYVYFDEERQITVASLSSAISDASELLRAFSPLLTAEQAAKMLDAFTKCFAPSITDKEGEKK
jgi:hypothetical protein